MLSIPIFLALLTAAAAAASAARAGDAATPVVVELYTSQGCIACPPADAVFGEIAGMDGVVALALHVDYWDYLGWQDEFGRPEHTARQKAYAAVVGARTLYTPQIVVQGEDRLKGHDAEAILSDIETRRQEAARATVSADRSGTTLTLHMAPVAGPVGAADVQVVSYVPSRTVAIERGDNAGQEITYANVVTDWRTVGRWDGSGPFDLTVADVADGPVAVIVQQARLGPVLAATRLP